MPRMRSNFIAAYFFEWWAWYAGFAILAICLLARRWKLLFVMLAVLVIANFVVRRLLLE